MKRLFCVLGLCSLLMSCSSSDTDAKVVALQRMPVDDARIAFKMMSAQERLEFWQQELANALVNAEYSTEEKALIVELQGVLKTECFTNDSNTYKEYFKGIFTPDFLSRVEKKGGGRLPNLFFGLSFAPDKTKDCNCNQGSLFGCGPNCEDKKCSVDRDDTTGCGFLWAWECNGLCSSTDI